MAEDSDKDVNSLPKINHKGGAFDHFKNNLTITFSAGLIVILAFASILTAQMVSRPQTSLNNSAKGQTFPTVYSFQQGSAGYNGTTDSTLRSDRVKQNLGSNTLLKVQADNWILGVIRFDLSSIPSNSTVQTAKLELYLNGKNDTKSFNMELYRLLRPWVENQTNWKLAMTGVNWGAEGANQIGVDREGTAVASVSVNTTKQWYSLDITQAIQGWVNNPNSNYGFVLRGDNANNAEYHFASSNFTTPSLRPRLTVNLIPGVLPTPTPTSAVLTPTPTPTPPSGATPTPTKVPSTPTPTSAPTPTSPPSGGIWKPALNTSWHWMIDHALDVNNAKDMGLVDPNGNPVTDYLGNSVPVPEVYDIDGFFNGQDPNCNIKDVGGNCVQGENNAVAQLHAMGKKVICYVDLGVYENYRPDAYKFPPEVIGSPDSGWSGSYWLDIRRIDILLPIMTARMKMCKDKGFDSIEPDEMVNYSNNSGFPLTYQDQLNYNIAIANAAHQMGISIGLKDDIEQSADLVNYFDWNLNEECYQYNECTDYGGGLDLFVKAGKAVFVAEYKTSTANFCPNANAHNYNAAKFPLNLNGGRWPCR